MSKFQGVKEAPSCLKRLQEANLTHRREGLGFKTHPKGIQEASRGFKRLQEAFKSKSDAQARRIRGIGPFLLQIHCVLQSLFDGASNPLCFRASRWRAVQGGRACPPTRERLQEANLTHRREGFEAWASWKLQEASRRHPRSFKKPLGGFKRHPRGIQEASSCLLYTSPRPRDATRGGMPS